MNPFKAGDKAVCVDDSWPEVEPNTRPNQMIVKGTTYLVTGISPTGQGIFVAGHVITGLISGRTDFGFKHTRFRKVVTATELAELQLEAKC